jgi:hypothetical protein
MINRLTVVALLAIPGIVSGADFFRIASFNIEFLGTRTPAQQPIAIAEHIDLSGAVAIALQEIGVTDTQADDPATVFDESRRNDALDTAFSLLNQEGDTEWRYELFPNRTPSDTSQLCGIAWDVKRVSRQLPAFKVNVSGPGASEIWDRRPHAVKLTFGQADQNKTDIVLISVHMKSNVDGAAIGRNTRKKEAEALVSQLGAIKAHFGGEDDLIILGDTNFLNANEPAAEAFGDAGLRDTNSLDASTFIGSSTSPFDRFFLSSSPEFTFARQYILRATEPSAHENFLSDHQMVLMSFRAKNDDD